MNTRRMMAIIAVVALASVALAVSISDDGDAWGSTYKVTSAAKGTSGMKVLAYDDGVLLIDASSMNLGNRVQFIAGITAHDSDTGDDKTPVERRVGPISMQNGRFWIDAQGADDSGYNLLQNNQQTMVKLYPYPSGEALDTADITYSETAITVHMYKNFSGNDASQVNDGTTATDYGSSGNWARNVPNNATTSGDSPKIAAAPTSYSLKGFAQTGPANANVVVAPNAALSVEDIIFEMYDSGVATPIVSNAVTLYCIWQKPTYFMLVADDLVKASPSDYKNANVPLHIGGTTSDYQKAKANLTEKVAVNDFGLLRIEQTVPGNYSYTLGSFEKYTIDESGEGSWEDATEGAGHDYEWSMVTNGVYKIVPHADIRFTVTMATVDNTTDGYSFTINSVTNTDDDGNAQLSLDLYDYKAAADMNISMNGTYYRSLGTSTSEVRVYGNIDSLTIDGYESKPGSGNSWTAKRGGVAVASTDIDNTGSTKVLNKGGYLKLDTVNNTYDLILDLDGYNVYGVQGQWDNFADGASQMTIYTPWALYQNE